MWVANNYVAIYKCHHKLMSSCSFIDYFGGNIQSSIYSSYNAISLNIHHQNIISVTSEIINFASLIIIHCHANFTIALCMKLAIVISNHHNVVNSILVGPHLTTTYNVST